MSKHYDIIIIGGGNAGLGVSAVAAEAGKSIAFIEGRDFGGTCPNRGCTPKKVLVAAGHTLHEIERAQAHGIRVNEPTLDWTHLIDRAQDMISFIPDAIAGVAEKRGDVYRGFARFTGPDSVEVNGEVLTADHIVIATGSKPRALPIPGAELMITSDEVLSERAQPQEVIFVGGGVIALEFAHVYQRAGTQVTILEVMPQLLPRLETDAVAQLRAETERLGVRVHTGVSVSSIDADGDRLAVNVEIDGKPQRLVADRVVNGAGRVANVDSLDLDAAGVEHDGVAIALDKTLRSVSNPRVYVAGDALVQSPQLSPLATWEGRIVGENIVNAAGIEPDYQVVPSVVHTVPSLATVGLSEAEAEAEGRDVEVSVNDMTGWFSGKSYAETVAWSKVLVDRSTDEIVGAHLVGHRAEELVHIFGLAMQHGISATKLRTTQFAFPTFSSDVKNLF
ncbi:MAG: NAD(P)/FAD-dependent oxidoreductase [Pseudomonadota bacterium]